MMARTQSRQWKLTLLYLLALVLVMFFMLRRGSIASSPKELSYSEFLSELQAGHLTEVTIGAQHLLGKLTPDAAKAEGGHAQIRATRLPDINDAALLKEIEAQHLNVVGHIATQSWWVGALSWLLPIIIIAGFWGYGLWRVNKGAASALTFGKNRAKIHDQLSQTMVTFADVAGVDEAEAELIEVVDFRQVIVDRPDLPGREAILKVHARNVKLAPAVDLKTIAARTPGMVGADLANVINESALVAARRGAQEVEMRDLEEAIDRVMLGLEKKSRVMSNQEKERVAHHETGHALVALSVKHADPVHRVSIIPRSIGALGHTLQLPMQEKYLMTKPELEDRIAVMLGGRAAEEIVYEGVVSTGAADDLERASELARQIVTRFGMSERLGQLTYGRAVTMRFLQSPFSEEERNYSERTAEQIDDESRRLIDEGYERVKAILTARREDLTWSGSPKRSCEKRRSVMTNSRTCWRRRPRHQSGLPDRARKGSEVSNG